MTTNPPNVGRHFGRVQILVFTPKQKKMARVPPCVSYMFVTQKSGRVQILVLTPTLKQKNGQGTALCFIHLFGSEIRQSTYNPDRRHRPQGLYNKQYPPVYIFCLFPPPCIWHAWRVVLTAVLEFLSGIHSQQFWKNNSGKQKQNKTRKTITD